MKKRLRYIIVTIAGIIICISQVEAQIQKIDLGGIWNFRTDPGNVGLKEQWYAGDDFRQWDNITVPGNWDVRNEYESYAGKAWYTSTFRVEKEWQEKLIRIFFESVYYETIVWINGREIGRNDLGFLPFSLDLNPWVNYGEENRITLLVDNTFKRGAMWNWGGIRRPVWMEITNPVRLEYQHITAIPDIKRKTAQLSILFEVYNSGKEPAPLSCELDIWHKGTKVKTYKAALPGVVDPGERKQQSVTLGLSGKEVHLWHFHTPHIYTSHLRIYRERELIHESEDRFGIRKIEVDGEQFRLNGEIVRTVGFNLVAEDRTTGSTLPLWRIMQDVDLMKSLGANMARISHLPLPKDFLDYLDEKGIMTFEEVALWGKDAMVNPDHPKPKEWLQRMIHTKYNHPSIIGWSVGNEIGYPGMNPLVREYVEGAIKQAKQLDPHRLAVYVSNSAHVRIDDATVFSDIIMLNRYRQWGTDAEKAHTNYPGKPVFYCEYGNTITDEDPDKGVIPVSEMLNEMRGKPYLMGASYWTFNDYRSSYSGTPPSGNRSWGVMTTSRKPKRAWYQFRKEYLPFKEMYLKDPEKVEFIPRDKYDIPAYPVRGYTLLWEKYDRNNRIMDGGFKEIKEVLPGDAAFTESLRWTNNKDKTNEESHIQIRLLDPLHYTVYDTTCWLINPAIQDIEPHKEITLSTSEKPPVIWDTEPTPDGWFIHYSVTANDYLYQVQYRKAHESYRDENYFQLQTKGTGRISGLENGETYYFRIRRLMEWGFAGNWSEEIKITTGNDYPQSIDPVGIIRNNKSAFIIFNPPVKATGYNVRITDKKTGTIRIKEYKVSSIQCLFIDQLIKNREYTFEIETVLNDQGSGYILIPTN